MSITEDLGGTSSEPVTFDPTKSHVPMVQNPWDMAIYSTLLRPTPSGGYLPELATSATIVDPRTIAVQLRPGVVFSDGTPVTALAVKQGILRNRDSKASAFQAILQDVSGIDVTGDSAITIHLSAPVAGAFYPLLAGEESFIVSPAASSGDLNNHPVGAGPFVLQQYVPDQKIVLARNPRYWDAKDIRISELEYVNTAPGPQQVNALESNLANVSQIPISDVPAVRSNSAYTVGTAAAQTQSLWMPVCKSTAPLNLVPVRQALSYAIDRPAINAAVLKGVGEPQWALWPQGSIYFPAQLRNYYAYNPQKAQQLLAQAGYPNGFPLSILISPSPVIEQAATIIQQEWKAIGVKATLVTSSNFVNDLYIRKVAPLGINPEVRGGVAVLTGPYQPGSEGDLCNFDNHSLDAIASQLSSLAPQNPKAIDLWRQAQTYVVQNALSIWLEFSPYVFASSKKVSGVQFLAQYALPVPYYWSLSVGG
ncbi:MAG: ABC transporter substrate-binding protein [Actinomycetota bacterium]|nr:ABC transporter substrate-binding protein [Actinomycetota bacterium]